MSEFYDDSPMSLIGPNEEENHEQECKNIAAAEEWAKDYNRIIILPTEDLSNLEMQWINFNNMIKKNRRESDWKSLELFNKTNQTRYEELRDTLLSNDIENSIDTDSASISSNENNHITNESYIEPADSYYDADAINYTSEDVEKARNWAKESNRTIILPTRTLEELESLWDSYNMMIKKHRRESDWMSLELFGLTNLKHYEFLKSQFLKQDLDKNRDYSYYIEGSTVSDIKRYVNEVCENESISEISNLLLSLNRPNKTICEELVINNVISDAIANYDGLSNTCPTMQDTYNDMPYYTPEEMIDMGVYGQTPAENCYGELADNTKIGDISVKEWFEMYKYTEKGFYTEMGKLCSDWVNTVRTLMAELNLMKENEAEASKINAKKQSILELGWAPEIPFDNVERMVAKEIASRRFREKSNHVQMINLCEFTKRFNEAISLNESVDDHIQPIFVVLIEGKSRFSSAIKNITHSIYSHVALSFDASLEKMYSYGISNREHSGFGVENIKDIPITSKIGLYVFFVSKEVKQKMIDMVENLKINIDKTRYSYKNLLTFLFNIPYNNEWKMICSQFVDRCLKLAGIDVSNTDSSLVSPKKMEEYMKKNKKYIYNLFTGERTEYNGNKVEKLVEALSNKAKPIKEQEAFYYESEGNYISDVMNNCDNIPVLFDLQDYSSILKNSTNSKIINDILFESINVKLYCESTNNSFPIQFDKNGDMIIKKNKKIDYLGEYAKSHKLLKQYQSYGNLEGMKYELAKLWMMLSMIEERIHDKKFKELPSSAIATSAEIKSKANITNDFQYYMKEVMKKDPNFNFTEYFEASPFNKALIKINGTTISFMTDLIKKFIKSI